MHVKQTNLKGVKSLRKIALLSWIPPNLRTIESLQFSRHKMRNFLIAPGLKHSNVVRLWKIQMGGMIPPISFSGSSRIKRFFHGRRCENDRY